MTMNSRAYVKNMSTPDLEALITSANVELISRSVSAEIAKATQTPKPITEAMVIIDNIPYPAEKLTSEIVKKAMQGVRLHPLIEKGSTIPKPMPISFKWAGTEQELEAILEDAAMKVPPIEAVEPPSEQEIALVMMEQQADHLRGCPQCRAAHIQNLRASIQEIEGLIAIQKVPRLVEILKEQRSGLQQQIALYESM